MNANVWYVIELLGFILAGVCLVLSIILFIKLKVIDLVSELSGSRFKKEVKQIRDSNLSSNKREYERRKALAPIEFKPEEFAGENNEQPKEEQVSHKDLESTSILSYDTTNTMVLSTKTSILNEAGETSVLSSDKQFQVVREIQIIHTDERII